MSPTLICTMSRSAASSWLCVPLPLPCTPMITYLRMSSAWHTQRRVRITGQAELSLAGPAHLVADQRAQLRPVLAQPLRVEEASQVVPSTLADHDAVEQE